MVRVIVTVLLVLVVLAYAALFLSWNQAPVEVTGLVWAGQGWVEDVPLGMLILGGVLAGAALMALFAAGAYQTQRGRTRAAEAKVALAKRKLDELVGKVKQQRERIAQLEQERATESSPATPEESPPDVAGATELGEDEADI